jgi:hypothetical protein
MTRALSLTCTALLLVGLGGTAFAGKPQIAVLGLEVVDQSGTPTPADTQAAKELTEGLRARAKAGTGPYQLAPGSDKELIDQKLLNNCDNEALNCMGAIGEQLKADILMYGHFEKQGKNYQVSLRVIDVSRKSSLKTSSDLIPVTDASGAALQGWAKKIYAKLTGESAGATITVEIKNADRGTLLVDGKPRGTFSNNTGTFSGLEGKVRIGVEAEGYRRWEKDITVASTTQPIPVELEKIEGPPPPPCTGPDCNTIITPPPGHTEGKSNTVWKIGIGVGGVLAVGGAYLAYSNWQKMADERDQQCQYGIQPVDHTGCMLPDGATPWTDKQIADSNARGDHYQTLANVGWGLVAAGAAVSVISVIKVVTSDSGSATEHQSMRGKRQRKNNRTFVVTPVMSPKGGGATLRLDW